MYYPFKIIGFFSYLLYKNREEEFNGGCSTGWCRRSTCKILGSVVEVVWKDGVGGCGWKRWVKEGVITTVKRESVSIFEF